MASVTMPVEMGRPEQSFFGILRRGYAYRNLLYLLLSPLVAYLSGLLIVVIIGLQDGSLTAFAPVFILLCAWPVSVVERGLARALLDVNFTPMARPLPVNVTLWDRFKAHMLNPVTWKSVIFLASRVLFGLFAFVLTVALLGLALSCLLAPLLYLATLTVNWMSLGDYLLSLGIVAGDWAHGYGRQVAPYVHFSVPGLAFAIALVPLGIVVSAVALHIIHGVSVGWGWYARNMLGINPKDIELAEARAATHAASARAEEAEKSRRQLILDASHELRTPVATVRAHIDSLLLLEGDHLPEQVRNYLAITQREVERLSLLVNDLLMLARADSDGFQLALRPVSVDDVVEEVFQALEPLAAHERQVTLVHTIADDLPSALADRDRLAQVILNLARNAITYTPAGGIVSLEVARGEEPETLAITVTDTGIGIEEDDLPHIFERFYRTDASRARHSGGFGLGLSITRDLVEAMGGNIIAERVPPVGSRFTVTLPVAPVPTAQAR